MATASGPTTTGENSINYSFRAMAQDQVEVMEKLGYREFFVAGHDRGARTTARMCLDHPDRVKRAALVDILPNHHVWTHTSRKWAISSWHWSMMVQPYDFPERMLAGIPARYFMEKKLSKPGIGLGFFDPEAFDEYVRCFNWKTIKGSCADYRACATCDFDMDTADFEAGNKITVPLLVIWGQRSHTEGVHGDVLSVWKKNYATDAWGGALPLRPLRAGGSAGRDVRALHEAFQRLTVSMGFAALSGLKQAGCRRRSDLDRGRLARHRKPDAGETPAVRF